jgi:hypothetical protein
LHAWNIPAVNNSQCGAELTRAQFNVGAERFIRDWRTTEVILSVRDLRMHEHHPLVGIVVLPLAQVFKQRSQVNDYFPLSGGIGRPAFMRGASSPINLSL